MYYKIGITRVPELNYLFGTELLFIDLPGLDITTLNNFSELKLLNRQDLVYISVIVPKHPIEGRRYYPSYSSTRYLRDITTNQKSDWSSRHPYPDKLGCRIFLDLSTFRNSKGYTHSVITKQRKRLSRKLVSESCIIGSIAFIDNTMSLGEKKAKYIWLSEREIGSICKLLFELYEV